MEQATLFYDADCGLCRWSVAKVAAWDRRGQVRLMPLQDRAEGDRILGSMDEERRMASWHLVTTDRTVHSGGHGVVPLLPLLPGGRPLARVAASIQPLTDVAYDFIVQHRSAFGGLLTRAARRRADERLRRRGAL